jgi:hypothetical protein
VRWPRFRQRRFGASAQHRPAPRGKKRIREERFRAGEARAEDARASFSPFALGDASRARSSTREPASRRGELVDPPRGSGSSAYLKSTVRGLALLGATPANLFPATFHEPFACRRHPCETRAIGRRETASDGLNLPTFARTAKTRAPKCVPARGRSGARGTHESTSVRGLFPNSREKTRGLVSIKMVLNRHASTVREPRIVLLGFADPRSPSTHASSVMRARFGCWRVAERRRATRSASWWPSCARRPALRRALRAVAPPVSPSRARCRVVG